MKKNIVLVGAGGGIGFRHFQSLLNISLDSCIYAIDVSEANLAKAKEWGESNKSKKIDIIYSENVECLPLFIDVLIIATSSKPRRQVFESIVDKKYVKYVIFEKFLFPVEEDYIAVSKLIQEKKITAYINCPYRLYDGYKKIKAKISRTKMLNVQMSGTMWGISCNAIHIVDCVGYLLDSYEDIICDTSLLDTNVLNSKRLGYIEFTGTFICSIANKACIVMESFADGNVPITITYSCDAGTWIVSHSNQTIVEIIGGQVKKREFPIYYQSQLTSKVVEQILIDGDCSLTKYEDTVPWHLSLLKAFLSQYNWNNNTRNNNYLAIT